MHYRTSIRLLVVLFIFIMFIIFCHYLLEVSVKNFVQDLFNVIRFDMIKHAALIVISLENFITSVML